MRESDISLYNLTHFIVIIVFRNCYSVYITKDSHQANKEPRFLQAVDNMLHSMYIYFAQSRHFYGDHLLDETWHHEIEVGV